MRFILYLELPVSVQLANMTHRFGSELAFIVLFALVFVVYSKPVQKPKDTEEAKKDEWRKEDDPAYVKYLKQVIEILEEDENFAKKLENVTEEDIRSGKIADEIDFASHHIRTRLDELKRKEIESQRQLLRKQEDVRRGIHREYWNPLNDRNNPNTFEVDDLKRLLAKVLFSMEDDAGGGEFLFHTDQHSGHIGGEVDVVCYGSLELCLFHTLQIETSP